MMTGVEQMEERKVESLEGEGSPEKLIIDEEMQEREQEISGVGSSPVGSFPSLCNSQSSGDNKMILCFSYRKSEGVKIRRYSI